MFPFRRRPADENDVPPPAHWSAVEDALRRADRVHDGEVAAWVMWREIQARWAGEAERMRRKGLL